MWTTATQTLSREKPCQPLPDSLPPPGMVQGAPGLAFAVQSVTEQRALWSNAGWDANVVAYLSCRSQGWETQGPLWIKSGVSISNQYTATKDQSTHP